MRRALTSAEANALAAARLSQGLAMGWRPQPLPPALALAPGEAVYAATGVEVLHHTDAEVTYQTGMFLMFGNPLLTLATVAGSVAFNSGRRKRSEAAAATQWRHLDDGIAHFTNRRFGFQGRKGWVDFWYVAIRASHCDVDGIVLYFDGVPPYKLRCWAPEWHFVLFRFLAYGDVAQLNLADSLVQKATALGELVPGHGPARRSIEP